MNTSTAPLTMDALPERAPRLKGYRFGTGNGKKYAVLAPNKREAMEKGFAEYTNNPAYWGGWEYLGVAK